MSAASFRTGRTKEQGAKGPNLEIAADRFYTSTIGKKAVMAASGCILFLFVVGHLIGNLQIYEGPEKLNHYAVLLRSMPALLWGVRAVLLLMVVLHIWSSVQLAVRNLGARDRKSVV